MPTPSGTARGVGEAVFAELVSDQFSARVSILATVARVFDKAKFHQDSCVKAGLPAEQSFVHTGIFLAWMLLHDMVKLEPGGEDVAAETKARRVPPTAFYEWNDGVFIDTQLTPEGKRFAESYFDFESGLFLNDYLAYAAHGLPGEFHVPNTWESYDRMTSVIEARYRQFKGENAALPPKPVKREDPPPRGFKWPWSKR